MGFAFMAVAIASFQLFGLLTRRTMTLGDMVAGLVRRESVRWLLLASWLWLGWHLFVRVEL